MTTITLNSSSVSLDAFGATFQLTATLTDQNGDPITDRTPTWSSDDNGVATVSDNGLLTAVANGSASVTVSAGEASAAVPVSVEQTAASMVKTVGDGQSGQVGQEAGSPIEVRVLDGMGNPLIGAPVAFVAQSGGGSVSDSEVATDADGRASTRWTLGPTVGASDTARASIETISATFTATAIAGPADSLAIISGSGQTAPAGTTLPDSLVAMVVDQFGNGIPAHNVTFTVTSGGGSVSPITLSTGVDGRAATEWTLGAIVGQQTVDATAPGITKGSPATYTADAISGTVFINGGDNQTGLVGYAPNVQPSVRLEDGNGDPIVGATVTFSVTSGGGSVTGAVQATDLQGIAQVDKWTLGSGAGTNTLEATVSGAGFANNPATFTAQAAAAAFDIEIRHLTTPTTSQGEAFDSAEVRWERLVFGDLANQSVNVGADACGITHPAVNETIDDLVIYVRLEAIDGPGGVLGSAGPCVLRGNDQPVLGVMRFDTDDLTTLEVNGQLEDVILHEMGHVLGIGTVWSNFGFLQNPSLPDPGGEDTHFNGPQAITAFDSLGGTSYTGGGKVPVENAQGGQGTRDAHWRESVFDHELMTGFIEPSGTANPLSRMSVASLWDLSYTVNLDDADQYTQVFTAPPAAPSIAGKLHLKDDVWQGPVFTVDSAGTLRLLRR